MGLLSKLIPSNDRSGGEPKDEPIYSKNYAGFRVKVFKTHIECRDQRGVKRNIPVSQVANVGMPFGYRQVHIETAGGDVIKVPINDRKGFRDAVFQAMNSTGGTGSVTAALSPADELKKYADLKEQGVISAEEFESKKKEILG